jgi:curved DNA-binding protein
MIDYYQTLGVNKNASQDEIKKAYRKMSMKHHPDRGGDEKQFKQINEAYATLSDSQKKAQYDNPHQHQAYHFNSGDVNDIFEQMFGGFGGAPFGFRGGQQRGRSMRNKDLNINIEVTLEDVVRGKEVVGSIKLPSGRDQALNLSIPPGVQGGDSIKFQGLGDDSIPGQPRGNIIASIREIRHPDFKRIDRNLHTEVEVNSFEAIIGKTIKVRTIDNATLDVKIPAGINSGQSVKCAGYGVPSTSNPHRGDLIISVKVLTNKNLSAEDIKILEQMAKKY